METVLMREQLEARVVEAMDAATREPMQWGVDDCAMWVATAIAPVVGYDFARDFRGRYRSRRGAARVLGRKGLPAAVLREARRHKWKRIAPQWARPGDTGLVWTLGPDQKPVLAMAVCRARGWFVSRSDNGFAAFPAGKVAAAWCVGNDLQPGMRSGLRKIELRPALAPTAAACYEPVSTFIGLTALISSFGASAAVAGAIGGALVSGALSVALSFGASLLAPKPQAGSGLDHSLSRADQVQGVQITERQPIPAKRVIVGTAYVGGALFFERVTAPYLVQGILLNYGQISAIEAVYIGTNRLSFSSITENTILTPVSVAGQPSYSTRLSACFRYGSAAQAADALILANYSSVTSDFRQRGVATASYKFHFGTDQTEFLALWGQVQRPNVFHVVKGVRVYDPRDPTQDMDDESTWEWSNNATLIQAWYLTRSWGGRIPLAKIRWEKIIESADYDDSLIGCADGTMIRRHTIDGVVMLNQRPFDVMQQLLTANRATICEAGGLVWIESAKPRTAKFTISDRMLTSGIVFNAARQKSDLVNKLQVRFVSPDREYQLVDGPILDRTDLQTDDAEVLPATLALQYTTDHRRAQYLQKAFLDSSRVGKTLSVSVDPVVMANVADADEELLGTVCNFSSDLFSKANGEYLVTGVGFSDDCTSLNLSLTEYDSSIETDWNPSADEQEFELAET